MKMITEEQRQALITHARVYLAAGVRSKTDKLVAIALASLTASAFGEVCGVMGAKYDVVRFAGESPIYHGEKVYTAPPVPTLPEKLCANEICHLLAEKYNMDVSTKQLDDGCADEVWIACVNEMARINGVDN